MYVRSCFFFLSNYLSIKMFQNTNKKNNINEIIEQPNNGYKIKLCH